jgi:hypothetical protein
VLGFVRGALALWSDVHACVILSASFIRAAFHGDKQCALVRVITMRVRQSGSMSFIYRIAAVFKVEARGKSIMAT